MSVKFIPNTFKKIHWVVKNFGLKKVIYSAGMPRSGSTLLYNTIRLILQKKYRDSLRSSWIGEGDQIPNASVYLIKTHNLDFIDYLRTSYIFYSFRDVRDVLISRMRKFDKEPELGMVRLYLNEYKKAQKYADLMVKYEDMVTNLDPVILNISKILSIDVDVDEIKMGLPSPNNTDVPEKGHDKKTLLHQNHVTGTGQGEWRDVLDGKLIDQIHTEFGGWLKENGYDV